MKFTELMSATVLFKDCKNDSEKKEVLIAYTKWLENFYQRPITTKDFDVSGRIYYRTIMKYFDGSMKKFHSNFVVKKIFFNEKIPAEILLRGLEDEKLCQDKIIEYANWLSETFNRPLRREDFAISGRIHYKTIERYFGSCFELFNKCNFQPIQRKKNMTLAEFKNYLKEIKTINEKGCWITNIYDNSRRTKRLRIRFEGKSQLLYRVSYQVFNGKLSEGLLVMHKCDNPACFNPKHLKLGTQSDNMKDCASKQRSSTLRPRRIRPHGIKDPYDYKALLEFVKQYSVVTDKNPLIFISNYGICETIFRSY